MSGLIDQISIHLLISLVIHSGPFWDSAVGGCLGLDGLRNQNLTNFLWTWKEIGWNSGKPTKKGDSFFVEKKKRNGHFYQKCHGFPPSPAFYWRQQQIIWFPSGGAIPQNEIESFLNWFPVFNFGRISQNRGSFEGCFVFFLLFPRRWCWQWGDWGKGESVNNWLHSLCLVGTGLQRDPAPPD